MLESIVHRSIHGYEGCVVLSSEQVLEDLNVEGRRTRDVHHG